MTGLPSAVLSTGALTMIWCAQALGFWNAVAAVPMPLNETVSASPWLGATFATPVGPPVDRTDGLARLTSRRSSLISASELL
jgi:hypothetical protein